MKPDGMPMNVWVWLNEQTTPFLVILPISENKTVYFETDPDVLREMTEAYMLASRRRYKKRLEGQNKS